MALYALVYEVGDPKEILNIDLSDVYFFKFDPKERGFIYHHTNGKTYRTANKMGNVEESESLYDEGFYQSDSGTMINIKWAKRVDRSTGTVIFDDQTEKSGLRANIVRPQVALIRKLLERR